MSILDRFSAEEIEEIKKELKIRDKALKDYILYDIRHKAIEKLDGILDSSDFTLASVESWKAIIVLADHICRNYRPRKDKFGKIVKSRRNTIEREKIPHYTEVVESLLETVYKLGESQEKAR